MATSKVQDTVEFCSVSVMDRSNHCTYGQDSEIAIFVHGKK